MNYIDSVQSYWDDKTTDKWIYGICIGLGLFHFFSYMRVESYAPDSSYYIGLIRSIVERGKYEFNFAPHVLYPPAYPGLLSLISIPFGISYFVFVRAAAIIGMLGLIASYELVARMEGRRVAAAQCLVLGFSGFYFYMAAQLVGSDVPYFLTSSLTLLLVLKAEQSQGSKSSLAAKSLIALLLLLSILTRTVGAALLIGMAIWLLVGFWIDRKAGIARLKLLAPAIVCGTLALAGWLLWTQHVKTQSIGEFGLGETYVDQFWLVNPLRPELGYATLADFIYRGGKNLLIHGANAAVVLTRIPWVEPLLYSPLVVVTIALVIFGWLTSVQNAGGGVADWYFTVYMMIYLLWPFDVGPRFVFPVFPLIFIYLYRGCIWLVRCNRSNATTCHRVMLTVSLSLLVMAVMDVLAKSGTASLQSKGSAVFWLLAGAYAALGSFGGLERLRQRLTIGGQDMAKTALAFAVGGLVLVGLLIQIRGLLYNIDPPVDDYVHQPSKYAADWITAHTSPDDVIMAQQVSILHRISGRRIISFPVLDDPREIMNSIRRRRVKFLVVITSSKSTNLVPTQVQRSGLLESAYPGQLKMIHRENSYRIYEILAPVPIDARARETRSDPAPVGLAKYSLLFQSFITFQRAGFRS